jgi:hypothetical protein
MKDKEILYKAVQKAINNGLDTVFLPYDVYIDKCVANDRFKDFYFDCKTYYSLIFSKDFAKTFYNTYLNYTCVKCNSKNLIVKSKHPNCNTIIMKCNDCKFIEGYWLEDWQYHLQQMVLCDEPLKYLEKFL